MMGVQWGTKIAALFTAAALMLGGAAGLPSAMAAEATTEMTAEELAATEKQYTDAVFTAVDYASIDYEPKQLKDLAVALEDLAKWLYQTGSISDLDLVRGSVGASERLLIKNGEGDGSDAVKASYITASVAVANAKTAWKSIYKQMEAAENASKAESPGIHVAPSHTDADPLPPGSIPTTYIMDNFQKTVTYAGFTDVLSTDWFLGSVKTAVEYGLVKGTSDTTFSPQGNVTVQEAVVMAARLRCIYNWGKNSVQSPDTTPVGNADAWASAEINFAIQSGIIQSTDFADYKVNITRAEMAYIFANALPESTGVYAAVNTIEDNAIPDVKTTDKYGAEIYTLYRAGVLTGGDGNRCNPDKAISRAETAAIVSRLPIPSEHKTFTIDTP